MSGVEGSSSDSGPIVTIDSLPDSALGYPPGWAVVAVDVLRSTTTAITALATGRRCLPVPSVRAAGRRAADLSDPLLAGEVGGTRPEGFEMNNSPAGMAARADVDRPVVLVSSSGTLLMHNAALSGRGYAACLRNVRSTALHLAERYRRVAVIGAGSRSHFREEDQFCCARIAASLIERGFRPGDARTADLVRRWTERPSDAWLESDSVRYLRSTGQERDLQFVLAHRDDLDLPVRIHGGELHAEREAAPEERGPDTGRGRLALPIARF